MQADVRNLILWGIDFVLGYTLLDMLETILLCIIIDLIFRKKRPCKLHKKRKLFLVIPFLELLSYR